MGVFGIIAGVVAIDQRAEYEFAVTKEQNLNSHWRFKKIEEQKTAELLAKTPIKNAPEDNEKTGQTPKADRENTKKEVDELIECFDDDSSVAYRRQRCKLKRDIATKKYGLKQEMKKDRYTSLSDSGKRDHTKEDNKQIKKLEAHLEYLETL